MHLYIFVCCIFSLWFSILSFFCDIYSGTSVIQTPIYWIFNYLDKVSWFCEYLVLWLVLRMYLLQLIEFIAISMFCDENVVVNLMSMGHFKQCWNNFNMNTHAQRINQHLVNFSYNNLSSSMNYICKCIFS